VLKQLAVLIFTIILLFQANNILLTVFFYKINKKYITDLFCVNKQQPEMKCHGKCFLNKKIKQQKEEQDKPIITIEVEVLKCLLKFMESFLIGMPSEKGKFIGFMTASNLQNPTEFDIFHPPQV